MCTEREKSFRSRIAISWTAFIVETQKLGGCNSRISGLCCWAAVRQMESRDKSSSQLCVLEVAQMAICYLNSTDKDFFSLSAVLGDTGFEIWDCQGLPVTELEVSRKSIHSLNSWRENFSRTSSLLFCSFLGCVKVSVQWPQHEAVTFVKCCSPQILIYELFSSASVDQKQLLPPRLAGREEAVLRGRRSASPSLPSSQTPAFQPGMPWPTCLCLEVPQALSAVSWMCLLPFFSF